MKAFPERFLFPVKTGEKLTQLVQVVFIMPRSMHTKRSPSAIIKELDSRVITAGMPVLS